jgi:hypothetical protein
VYREFRGHKETRVQLGHRELKEFKEHRDHREHKVIRAIREI